jgi:hypothetical protein
MEPSAASSLQTLARPSYSFSEIKFFRPQAPAAQKARVVPKAGYTVAAWFDDPAATGADTIDSRPGFMAALETIAGNGRQISSAVTLLAWIVGDSDFDPWKL